MHNTRTKILALFTLLGFGAVGVWLLGSSSAQNATIGFDSTKIQSNSVCKRQSDQTNLGEYLEFSASCGQFIGTPGFPLTYDENLALINSASVTRQTRTARLVGNTGFGNQGERNYALNEGNPFRYVPSVDLNIDDYVVQTGDRYANYAQRANGGVWHSTCQFSHFAYDDPVVFPNQPGVSHLHMFFGNTHSNAYSTPDTILNEGGSTCSRGELNRTSYWVPAVFNESHEAITPSYLMVYYESYGNELSTVQSFPSNLRFVTGDALATEVQPNVTGHNLPQVRWKCGWFGSAKIAGGGSAGPQSTTPTYCNPSTYSHVEMNIRFPWCWNGQDLDSTNHKDHVVFPTNGFSQDSNCPSTHSVKLPRITYRIHFETSLMKDSSKLTLSSDIQKKDGSVSPNGVSLHADWFSGWHRETLGILVANCARVQSESCDPEHLGDPAGRQFAKIFQSDQKFTPDEILEYCPLRSTYDNNLYNLAYCLPEQGN